MYEEQHTSPKATIEQALAPLFVFSKCSRVPKQKLFSVGCWQPPEEGSFKLNIDGAIFADLLVIEMGAIVQDNKGEMIL